MICIYNLIQILNICFKIVKNSVTNPYLFQNHIKKFVQWNNTKGEFLKVSEELGNLRPMFQVHHTKLLCGYKIKSYRLLL